MSRKNEVLDSSARRGTPSSVAFASRVEGPRVAPPSSGDALGELVVRAEGEVVTESPSLERHSEAFFRFDKRRYPESGRVTLERERPICGGAVLSEPEHPRSAGTTTRR